MAAYASGATAITTELIQKYLDENKQLILAILDNQNLGKLNECAQYQLKLQQNLMYLAAIADAQPQPTMAAAQVPSNMMQPGQHYLQQQQQQQQQQHILQQQALLSQRNAALQYQQHQQAQMHPALAHNGMHMLGSTEASLGGPTYGDYGSGRASGNASAGDVSGLQTSIGLGQAPRNDLGGAAAGGDATGAAAAAAAASNTGADEPSYLKASEDDGN